MENYFKKIDEEVARAYTAANRAKSNFPIDPIDKADIPLAKNMAERVLGLISIAAPQLLESDMVDRIVELEEEYEKLDWRVGFRIAEDVAKERFCKFSSRDEAMEIGIRVGFAYLTLGIVAAPLEGFIGLKIKKRKDGKEYLSIRYAGPVRGAGGTASAVSVILSDYIRVKMGIDAYDPTEEEVNRNITEITDYHERVTNLQYFPSERELRFMLRHLPLEIDGDPTEKLEVSNYKDLPRIETNQIRGGMCLVVAEGLSQKAPKIFKRLDKWGEEMSLGHWSFIKEFLEIQKEVKAKRTSSDGAKKEKVTPNHTYIKDIVAGRPVLGYPMANGAFRLRYGRARSSGFSAAAVHPTTLYALENYIAIGTQLKMERPGKAASITICELIEGPIVKLEDGSIVHLKDAKDIKSTISQIKEIIYLGDILFNYGDFSENGHKLVPAGYCEEWHYEEVCLLNIDEISKESREYIKRLNEDKFNFRPKFDEAYLFSRETGVPLHPRYTYFWKSIDKKMLNFLIKWLSEGGIHDKKFILPLNEKFMEGKRALELLGISHKVFMKESVILEEEDSAALNTILLPNKDELIQEEMTGDILTLLNDAAGIKIRDKCGTFIGARMGRPEKAKMRKMDGSPHGLFPVAEEGGRLRSINQCLEAGKITSEFPIYECSRCAKRSIYSICIHCGNSCDIIANCAKCGKLKGSVCSHEGVRSYEKKEIEIREYFTEAMERLDEKIPPDLIKGVKGMINKDKAVEYLGKAILRAKHNLYVNKDGTIRYDMSELPITHFKPKEIKTPIGRLKELGYLKDIFGKEIESEEQIVELKPQDIILPAQDSLSDSAKQVIFRIANFIDELLVKVYKREPYYKLRSEEDLVGQLVIGLAPHISAGLIGRIIGFSDTQGCFAHPLWHAGLRRDCDGDENCVILLMDALLNFSRKYLPDRRGSRSMDSPLVLTSKMIITEVDDQAHGIDIVSRYPVELYEAALEYKNPWEVKIEQINARMNNKDPFTGMMFTHDSGNINKGVLYSAYKTIPTMEDKLKGQMSLATKIRAVDQNAVANLVINRHFMRDIKGNLRKFTQQNFRCGKCNEKYRRPPLKGCCLECGNKLLFTVSEGSVIKYLQPSLILMQDYDLPPYMNQSLEILKGFIENVFGIEKEKQSALDSYFG